MTKADLCEYIRSKSSDLTKQQIADKDWKAITKQARAALAKRKTAT